MKQSLHYLRRNPGFTAVVVLTLALGIGANTAIFSIVRGIVLKPLPVRDPEQLVHIFETGRKDPKLFIRGADQSFITVRPGTFYDWKSQSSSFERMAITRMREVTLGGDQQAESVWSHRVAEDFFETMGTPPALGRWFQKQDFDRSAAVAILRHDLWRSRFAGDPHVIGKLVRVDNLPYEVVGVMPEGFLPTYFQEPKIWLPLTFDPAEKMSRTAWGHIVFARMRAGVTADTAQAEMTHVADNLSRAEPDGYRTLTAVVAPMEGYMIGRYESLFFLLLGAVALVLLIACVNVAGLVMTRATDRDRDFTLRAALGASQWVLIRQVLAESLTLSLAGGALGVMLAYFGLKPLMTLLPAMSRIPRLDAVSVDAPVLAFSLAVCVLTGVLCGLWPALRSSRPDPANTLKESGRSGRSAASNRATAGLVVLQVGLSVVLLMGAGLLLQNFRNLLNVDAGFRGDHMLGMRIRVPDYRYGTMQYLEPNVPRTRLYHEIEARLAAIPGVRRAAVTAQLPLKHGPNPWSISIEGRGAGAAGSPDVTYSPRTGRYYHGNVSIQQVTPGYLETLGLAMRSGRWFDDRDHAGAPRVAVINETTARRYFAGEDPVGKRVLVDMTSKTPQFTIVGVVSDTRMNGLDKDIYPQIFWALDQIPPASAWVAVRTGVDPETMMTAVRNAVTQIDPELPITEFKTMREVIGETLWRPRLAAVLLTMFGALALVLAVTGVYSVVAYSVARRRQEMGLRMTLGAAPANVFRLVLAHGMRLTGCGVVIGIAASLSLSRFAASYLYGVKATDPATLFAVCAFLLAVSLLACLAPATRAARVDPMTSLRHE
jgi:putative ABC transport system permease protein